MKINLAGDPMSSGIYFEQSRADFGRIFTPNWNYCWRVDGVPCRLHGTISAGPRTGRACLLAIGLGIAGIVGTVWCRLVLG